MENNKNYVIIHLINNQILINIDVTGLFSLPFFKDIKKMKKELNLASEDYIQGNIIKDKWYSTLIKEHYDFYNKFSMSNFYSNYLIITKPMINLENAQYISLDKLSELNYDDEEPEKSNSVINRLCATGRFRIRTITKTQSSDTIPIIAQLDEKQTVEE